MPEGVPYLRREVYKLRKRVSDFAANLQTLYTLFEALSLIKVYDTYQAVQLVNVQVDIILVKADYNGSSAIFVRESGYTVNLEGTDGVTDAAGKIFKRFQNE